MLGENLACLKSRSQTQIFYCAPDGRLWLSTNHDTAGRQLLVALTSGGDQEPPLLHDLLFAGI